ncbi:hypothetical protein ACFSQZ_02830 [Rubritalea spongiae]|uniref:PSRT domain-containing protein n=1 Tax=Rubritalea spongiae TaxID=430797 RepID=A0ABW5DZ48_9BACT
MILSLFLKSEKRNDNQATLRDKAHSSVSPADQTFRRRNSI